MSQHDITLLTCNLSWKETVKLTEHNTRSSVQHLGVVLLPGYEEVEHSQRHQRDPNMKGNSHSSVLFEDFL